MKNKKVFIQILVAITMLVFAVVFVREQHLEVKDIFKHLQNANWIWIIIGLIFTMFLILAHASIYFFSFKAIHQPIRFQNFIGLFLKRNLVSVLLPAGGFTSLSFFNFKLIKEGANKAQIYMGSYLYATIGLVSVVVVGVPFMLYMFFNGQLDQRILWGLLALIILIFLIGMVFYSILKQNKIYKYLVTKSSKVEQFVKDIDLAHLDLKQLSYALIASIFVELIGVIHLYIAFYAIGLEPNIVACLLAYIAMIILLLASPFLRGMGAIEVAMTYILSQYGYTTLEAAVSTLLFRFFEFWVLLVLGTFALIYSYFIKKITQNE